MSNESAKTPLARMNRRTMLGTTTAVLGGVIAGAAGDVLGQEKPKPAATSGSADTPAGGPNLAPPLVDTKNGKLRGLREGKTLSFLGGGGSITSQSANYEMVIDPAAYSKAALDGIRKFNAEVAKVARAQKP